MKDNWKLPLGLVFALSAPFLPLTAQEPPTSAGTKAATSETSPSPATADPFVKTPAQKEGGAAAPAGGSSPAGTSETFVNLGLLFQYIDVKREFWSAWLSENNPALDAGRLRREAEAWMTDGEALLVETSLVMGRSGQRSKVESVREMIKPIEFARPTTGHHFPTSFETMPVGTVLEVDPVLGADGRVQFAAAPERTHYAGETPPQEEPGVEPGDVRWPRFLQQKPMGSATLGENQWGLFGTVTSLERPDTHQTLIFGRPVLHRFETTVTHTEKPDSSRPGTQGQLTLRWLEVSHKDLNAHLLEEPDLSQLIGGGLYRTCVDAGAKPLDDRSLLLVTGQRATLESAEQRSYASEYVRAEDPPHSFSLPTGIETRNLGTRVETDAVFSPGGNVVDLNFAPEIVSASADSVHQRRRDGDLWLPDVVMPVFSVMKATTAVTLPFDTPVLVAVFSPPGEGGWIDPSRKVLLFVQVSR